MSRKIKAKAEERLDENAAAADVIDCDELFFLDCLVDLALQQLMIEVECDSADEAEGLIGDDTP